MLTQSNQGESGNMREKHDCFNYMIREAKYRNLLPRNPVSAHPWNTGRSGSDMISLLTAGCKSKKKNFLKFPCGHT